MNKVMLTTVAMGIVLMCATGCRHQTTLVNQDTDTEILTSLDYKDFENAATQTTNAILSSNKLRQVTADKTRVYSVAISKVIDNTPFHLDTDILTARVGEALLADDRFVISATFADKATNREAMIDTVRTARNNDEFDPTTVQQKGTLQAADFALSGKIIARDLRRDNGGHQYEYYFQLRMTDLKTGNVVMSKETKIIKRTDDKDHTWN